MEERDLFVFSSAVGLDADPDNDPTYPMRDRGPCEPRGYTWARPPLQPVRMEILQSIERIDMPAVFGTAAPPSGLSGAMRRFAYRYSESSYGHWLPLALADRVNAVEGVIDDLRCGYVPNWFKERGWGAYWRYDKRRLIRRAAWPAAIAAGTLTYLALRHRDGAASAPAPVLPPPHEPVALLEPATTDVGAAQQRPPAGQSQETLRVGEVAAAPGFPPPGFETAEQTVRAGR